ncbi:GL10633 [Drosophila persimilis]|uniref:GL10633 n=1 Tax=Drosophila persimilis TaxID=7234 RepID=B4GAW8_DROPE|nr:GL10633 [Drosophila persimilis]
MFFGSFFVFLSAFCGSDVVWFQLVYGFCYGSRQVGVRRLSVYATLRALIYVRYLGLSKLTNAFGITALAMSIAVFIGTTLGGILVEATQDYSAAFAMAVFCIMLSGSLKLVLARQGTETPHYQATSERYFQHHESPQHLKSVTVPAPLSKFSCVDLVMFANALPIRAKILREMSYMRRSLLDSTLRRRMMPMAGWSSNSTDDWEPIPCHYRVTNNPVCRPVAVSRPKYFRRPENCRTDEELAGDPRSSLGVFSRCNIPYRPQAKCMSSCGQRIDKTMYRPSRSLHRVYQQHWVEEKRYRKPRRRCPYRSGGSIDAASREEVRRTAQEDLPRLRSHQMPEAG